MKSLFITLVALFLCLAFNRFSYGDAGDPPIDPIMRVLGDEPDDTDNIFATITSEGEIAAFLSNSHEGFVDPSCLDNIFNLDIHKFLTAMGYKFSELRSRKVNGKVLGAVPTFWPYEFFITYTKKDSFIKTNAGYELTGTNTIIMRCNVKLIR